MDRRAWLLLPCAWLSLVLPGEAVGQSDEPATAVLTGALQRIRERGVVRIGFRENAVPFAYAKPGSAPYGYSIDLCLAIVEDIAAATGGKSLRVEYRPVTPQNRLDQIVQGSIDLECGSTTINAERLQRVAFSPVIFLAGTRLLVKRGSAVHSVRDLAGRTVVAVSGTTNARAMATLAAGRVPGLRVVSAPTYAEALEMVDRGAADALAADDILIMGLVAERGWRDRYAMVGEPLTHDPYGIAYPRGDLALQQVINAAFVRLATTAELRTTYNKWFLRPLPTGVRLGLPMSTALERSFQVLGLPPE